MPKPYLLLDLLGFNMSHVSKIPGVEEDNGGEFHPEGMHVLVIESNNVSLTVIVGVLKLCKYAVTATTAANEALKILRNNNEIDIVITNVMRPDMSGFELLEIISRETDLPVIMVSADDSNSTAMKSIRHGAEAYLPKPVRKQDIQNIFQHVIRKKLSSTEKSSITREIMEQKAMPSNKLEERIKDEDDEANTQSGGGPTNQKTPRLTWTRELHRKFVDAVHQLEAVDKVHPKRILENMNVKGLTREKVASHLQKYRKWLKKHKESMSQEANGAIDSCSYGGNSLGVISCNKRITKLGDNNAVDLIPNPNVLSNYSMDMNSVFLNPSHQNMLQYRTQSSNNVEQIQQGMNNLPVQEFRGYNFPTSYSGMNLPDKYMAMTSQSLDYNYHSYPGPKSVPFYSNPSASGPSSMPFYSNPSAYPNQFPCMLGLASTCMGATSQHASVVWPSQNLLPGQHNGGHPPGLCTGANSNYRGLTTDSTNNRQYPSTTGIITNDETQLLQQSSELSNMEKNFLYNSGSFTEYDLSMLLKQFNNDCPPKL